MNLHEEQLKENLGELKKTYLEQSSKRLEKFNQQVSLMSNEERIRLEALIQSEREKVLLEERKAVDVLKKSLLMEFEAAVRNKKSDPGQSLLNVLEYFVSEKKLENTFFPLVADWHKEYFNAQYENRGRLKLFCIHIRYGLAFAKACGLLAALKICFSVVLKFSGK